METQTVNPTRLITEQALSLAPHRNRSFFVYIVCNTEDFG